jgi:hypothetical protein
MERGRGGGRMHGLKLVAAAVVDVVIEAVGPAATVEAVIEVLKEGMGAALSAAFEEGCC